MSRSLLLSALGSSPSPSPRLRSCLALPAPPPLCRPSPSPPSYLGGAFPSLAADRVDPGQAPAGDRAWAFRLGDSDSGLDGGAFPGPFRVRLARLGQPGLKPPPPCRRPTGGRSRLGSSESSPVRPTPTSPHNKPPHPAPRWFELTVSLAWPRPQGRNSFEVGSAW
jgi:hypothetical protein